MSTPEQRATWRKEAEHRPGHLTHTRILALLDELEARDVREARVRALVDEWLSAGVTQHGEYPQVVSQAEDMCAHALEAALGGDDQAAMSIDPYPPGVTFRNFTDAEIAALDGDPVVCIAHGAFIPCRKDGEHRLSSNRYWIKVVRDYQGSTIPGLTWEPAWDDA